MSELLREETGVALSRVQVAVAGFNLWQSTREGLFLFTRAQPALARGDNGRYPVAVTTHRQQVPDRGLAVTGGSAIFTVTSAVQYDAAKFAEMTQAFRTGVVAAGAPDRDYKFVALNTRKGMAEVLINAASGRQREDFDGKDKGTPGGPMTFLVELTELGAQEWAQGIRQRSHIPAGVRYQYEYLTYVPPCGATVVLHGQRVFEHLSAELNASVQFGGFYGASAKLNAEWESMQRSGAIEIVFDGGGLPPELEKIRTELTTSFANQAREEWFKLLFEPAPEVEPAKAGTTTGFYGGANFALKWKKATEAVDLSQQITFRGWTWLTTSADADITTMFADLDDQYLTEVNAESTFPVSITVDRDPLYEHAAVSTKIYLFVRDGDDILPPSDEDYVIVNVAYSGPHLPRPLKASARLTAFQPVEFGYPLDPAGAAGTPKFSAFGVIGNRMIRAAEQPISLDEDAVFVLASPTEIKLVSQAAVVGEDTDTLAARLLAGAARPVLGRRVEDTVGATGEETPRAAGARQRPRAGVRARGHHRGAGVPDGRRQRLDRAAGRRSPDAGPAARRHEQRRVRRRLPAGAHRVRRRPEGQQGRRPAV